MHLDATAVEDSQPGCEGFLTTTLRICARMWYTRRTARVWQGQDLPPVWMWGERKGKSTVSLKEKDYLKQRCYKNAQTLVLSLIN